ncbi:MAG: FMN-binding protein [Schleiferilactobacillus perolens]|jgi:uncharacterized protein with FMN-binding domain|uniref:FMN-binding protein n=1 Tax=Schleiferilactobacillus perolens TaxID=100468 RepID=UPI0039E7535C|nr:FMN-binding protein [Schleiferilactobacillus harbinensis]
MYRRIVTLLLSLAIALAMVIDAYLLFFKKQTSPTTNATAASSHTTNSASSSTSTSSKLKDGTYTGKSVETEHGPVQLQMTVAGGKISKINVVVFPNEEQRSERINAQALPILQKEALAAQSAKIQQVSGATETSDGFKDSLQNAINQAQESETTS